MPLITAINIIGIQRYVFGSNTLRDVLAASWMVDHVTSKQQLLQASTQVNTRVLLAAGGNAILEFDSIGAARDWTSQYTRWVLETAPGLDVLVAHRPFEDGGLAWALCVIQIDLARARHERIPNVPQLGLSVTASCSTTGLPAVHVDRGSDVSPRIRQLRRRVSAARTRWNEYLAIPHAAQMPPLEFPGEVDLMGRTHGETSFVGVVHVDGNDIGQKIQAWLNRCVEAAVPDERVREQYCEWSAALTKLGREVTSAIVERTVSSIRPTQTDGGPHVVAGLPSELEFALCDSRDVEAEQICKALLLPLQPVLLGGDDLTFLCDGRVALDLAVTALKAFENHKIPHLGDEGQPALLTGCAGIALATAHTPFSRSYELAEALCGSAKRARRDTLESQTHCDASWLDWHIGSTRPGETVAQIRRRQYQCAFGDLTMRPYPVAKPGGHGGHPHGSWEWLDAAVLGPNTDDAVDKGLRDPGCWRESRSRVKRLPALARSGPDAVERQLRAWNTSDGLPSDELQLPGGLPRTGFLLNRTPLIDAIELQDVHLRLKPTKAVRAAEVVE